MLTLLILAILSVFVDIDLANPIKTPVDVDLRAAISERGDQQNTYYLDCGDLFGSTGWIQYCTAKPFFYECATSLIARKKKSAICEAKCTCKMLEWCNTYATNPWLVPCIGSQTGEVTGQTGEVTGQTVQYVQLGPDGAVVGHIYSNGTVFIDNTKVAAAAQLQDRDVQEIGESVGESHSLSTEDRSALTNVDPDVMTTELSLPDDTASGPSLAKRHNYCMTCGLNGDRASYDYCAQSPRQYYCDGNRALQKLGLYDRWCALYCSCQKGMVAEDPCPDCWDCFLHKQVNVEFPVCFGITPGLSGGSVDTNANNTTTTAATDLEVVPHTSDSLSKRHNYYMTCGAGRAGYDWCAQSPRQYYCDGNGGLGKLGLFDVWCAQNCLCHKGINMVQDPCPDCWDCFLHKQVDAVYPVCFGVTPGEIDAPNSGEMEKESLEVENGTETTATDTTTTDVTVKSSPTTTLDASLEKRHSFHMECGNRAGYNICAQAPRQYYCNSGGKTARLGQYDAWCTLNCKCRSGLQVVDPCPDCWSCFFREELFGVEIPVCYPGPGQTASGEITEPLTGIVVGEYVDAGNGSVVAVFNESKVAEVNAALILGGELTDTVTETDDEDGNAAATAQGGN